ncbi:MAG: MbnH family di-heme enzyme [Leptothrix sp. (in: b-proteobacteria)]
MKRHTLKVVMASVVALAGATLSACGGGGTQVQDTGVTNVAGWAFATPSNFPLPRDSADNPTTAAKVELGRFLFYDPRLSGNGRQSCSSCHQQDKAFTDGRPTAIGSTGQSHPRNSQSLVNVVYNATLTWANPTLVTLETQMLTPLFGASPVEMGVNDANKAEVIGRIAASTTPNYARLFARAFPEQAVPLNWDSVIRAISSFQRSLLSGNSRFDRYRDGKGTLTDAEVRGKNLFFGEQAECFHCHGSFNFNEQVIHATSRLVETPFRNTGLYNIGGTGDFPFPNQGLYSLTNAPADMGKFRAPSLRNVGVTAPYMHDGTMATLEEVLDFYAAGGRNITDGPHAGDGRANRNKDGLITLINLTPQDKADLVAFLRTLTDDDLLTDPLYANPFAPAARGAN